MAHRSIILAHITSTAMFESDVHVNGRGSMFHSGRETPLTSVSDKINHLYQNGPPFLHKADNGDFYANPDSDMWFFLESFFIMVVTCAMMWIILKLCSHVICSLLVVHSEKKRAKVEKRVFHFLSFSIMWGFNLLLFVSSNGFSCWFGNFVRWNDIGACTPHVLEIPFTSIMIHKYLQISFQYALAMSFYFVDLIRLLTNNVTEEESIMIAHHVLTLVLLSASFWNPYCYIGLITTFLYDISDIFLNLSSLVTNPSLKTGMEVSFMSTFFPLRVLIFNAILIVNYFTTSVKLPYQGPLFLLCGVPLFFANIAWTRKAVSLVIKRYTDADGSDNSSKKSR